MLSWDSASHLQGVVTFSTYPSASRNSASIVETPSSTLTFLNCFGYSRESVHEDVRDEGFPGMAWGYALPHPRPHSPIHTNAFVQKVLLRVGANNWELGCLAPTPQNDTRHLESPKTHSPRH